MATIPPAEEKQKKQSRRSWEELYAALKRYKEEHGDCEVPGRYKDSGLSWWVTRQRRHRDELSPDQRAKLAAIGFDLATIAERRERAWNEKFERLKDFRKEYLHCNVPLSSLFDEKLARWSDELGNWVSRQREIYRSGKMSTERQSKLNSIQFEWALIAPRKKANDSTTFDEKWHQQYLKLVEFHGDDGHCFVPPSKEPNNLNTWVIRQRRHYKDNSIPAYRKQLLDELGFVWNIDRADADASLNQRQWEGKLEKLKEFKETHGHCDVPIGFEKWGLGDWLCLQRYLKQKGRLDIRREEKLIALGVTWSVGDQRWGERFAKLRAFKQKHGHCCPRSTSHELYGWVFDQRHLQKENKLPPERKAKLDGIGFSWGKVFDDRWDQYFGLLQAFKQAHGHCRPPKKSQKLYSWVKYQRRCWKKGKLPTERKQKLGTIGFRWEGAGRSQKRKIDEVLDLKDSEDEGTGRSEGKKNPPRTQRGKRKLQKVHIGSRVAVYWSGDDEYYEGAVTRRGTKERSIFVEYDDGDEESVDLAETDIKVLGSNATKAQDERKANVAKLKIGSRVSVWWPAEKEYYAATLKETKDGNPRPHYLEYDDGDDEWTNLLHREFELLDCARL